jgi:SnoaL-like domain
MPTGLLLLMRGGLMTTRASAAFLAGARPQFLHRTAHAGGDLARVASESELRLQQDGKPVTLLSTETLVLRRGVYGWRIVHIHWSSRKKEFSPEH